MGGVDTRQADESISAASSSARSDLILDLQFIFAIKASYFILNGTHNGFLILYNFPTDN